MPTDLLPLASHLAPQCPAYCPSTPCLDEVNPCWRLDAGVLRSVVERLGFAVRDDSVAVMSQHGHFKISLRDGSIAFTPRQCLTCPRACPAIVPICIVASTRGYSSDASIGQAELLAITKIVALAGGDLPGQISAQVRRAVKRPRGKDCLSAANTCNSRSRRA